MNIKYQTQKIEVISFDGDMTLWDFEKVMRLALSYTLIEIQQKFPGPLPVQLTIDKMIEIRNETAKTFTGTSTNLEEIRYQAFRRTLLHVGIVDDAIAADLNALYLQHRFEDIELYEDVLPALRALKPHYQLGLCTNGNSYPDQCGLSGIFDFTVFAQDVGVEKPDKKIFYETLNKAGCSPESMIHIGDSLINDVCGAQQVGIIGVWLNRQHQKNETKIQPDFEIHSLTNLIEILDEFSHPWINSEK